MKSNVEYIILKRQHVPAAWPWDPLAGRHKPIMMTQEKAPLQLYEWWHPLGPPGRTDSAYRYQLVPGQAGGESFYSCYRKIPWIRFLGFTSPPRIASALSFRTHTTSNGAEGRRNCAPRPGLKITETARPCAATRIHHANTRCAPRAPTAQLHAALRTETRIRHASAPEPRLAALLLPLAPLLIVLLPLQGVLAPYYSYWHGYYSYWHSYTTRTSRYDSYYHRYYSS